MGQCVTKHYALLNVQLVHIRFNRELAVTGVSVAVPTDQAVWFMSVPDLLPPRRRGARRQRYALSAGSATPLKSVPVGVWHPFLYPFAGLNEMFTTAPMEAAAGVTVQEVGSGAGVEEGR